MKALLNKIYNISLFLSIVLILFTHFLPTIINNFDDLTHTNKQATLRRNFKL